MSLTSLEFTPFSIAILDIDRFKAVNDDLGHAVGDEVLKVFTDRITEQLRCSETLGRWGGDEFVLLTHGELGGICRML